MQRTEDARQTQSVTMVLGLAVSLLALFALTIGLSCWRGQRRLNRALVQQAVGRRRPRGALANPALFANVPDYLIVLTVEDDDRFVVADINPAFAKALRTSPPNGCAAMRSTSCCRPSRRSG